MFDDFKPVLKILLRFIIIYIVLLIFYQLFLNHYIREAIDPYSRFVASEVSFVQRYLGYTTELVDDPKIESIWFYVNGKYVSRMVEGCNAISVIILFIAFIFAFYNGYKTFVFATIGVIFLHIINFMRISWLNMIVLNFPKYQEIGHQYFFPAIIYGSVVVLWLIWVNYFVLNDAKTNNYE